MEKATVHGVAVRLTRAGTCLLVSGVVLFTISQFLPKYSARDLVMSPFLVTLQAFLYFLGDMAILASPLFIVAANLCGAIDAALSEGFTFIAERDLSLEAKRQPPGQSEAN
ncbi:MAG: hypothetical protein JSS72_12485 [Armatimonadetes bacterium]|nr:hypothetical protein [Armatimonadota bacterium]